jgi:hypothetical protein
VAGCPAVTEGGLPLTAGQTWVAELGVRATVAAGQAVCPIDAPGGHEQKTAKAKPARRRVLEVILNIAISLTDIGQMG